MDCGLVSYSYSVIASFFL
uniref:Uncharacterized protein n=1 Tax=Anguilla anguilla TaxID=7936 RepID=A0A0E9UQD5_ANGAN